MFRFRSVYNQEDFSSIIEKPVNDWMAGSNIKESNIIDIKHTMSEPDVTKGITDTILVLYKK